MKLNQIYYVIITILEHIQILWFKHVQFNQMFCTVL